MALADRQGRMLFELRPDLFPEGYLTDCELVLWGLHLEARQQRSG